jgi:hypothetical protein
MATQVSEEIAAKANAIKEEANGLFASTISPALVHYTLPSRPPLLWSNLGS